MDKVLLTTIEIIELKAIISDCISKELANIQLANNQQEKADKLLKTNDVARLLQVSGVTVATWKKEGKLPFLRIGNRVFFKESEVLNSMQSIKTKGVQS